MGTLSSRVTWAARDAFRIPLFDHILARRRVRGGEYEGEYAKQKIVIRVCG